MPASAKPEFTVATIKPSNPDAPRGGYGFRGQDVTTTNVTVNWMIKLAYNVHARQIGGERRGSIPRSTTWSGGPHSRPAQQGSDEANDSKLLADRFQLKFHTEKRELPVYAMVVLKTGAKVTVSKEDPNSFSGIGFSQGPAVRFPSLAATHPSTGW